MESDQIWQEIKNTGSLNGRKIHYRDEIDSTNVLAAEFARQGCACGTVVLAATQTHGRGRLGRPWQSPPGKGIYFSLIWHSKLDMSDLSKLTLAAGLGLSRAVEEQTGLPTFLKWPNDLLVNNKKVAGILTENYGDNQGRKLVIVGVGLNVNTSQKELPPDLAAKASSLYISSGQQYPLGGIFDAVIRSIEGSLMEMEAGEFKKILDAWRRKDATLGRELTWVTASRSMITGTSIGIDDQGILRIRDRLGEIHQVMSGDLNLAAT